MKVIAIREKGAKRAPKTVVATQKAVDAIPFQSGWWKVEGVHGLYLRADQATTKSFVLQRRVDGQLVKEVLGRITIKAAKEKAAAAWGTLKPEPQAGVTLSTAVETYIQNRKALGKMGPTTERLARYNLHKYLSEWKGKTLEQIGSDRPRLLALHARLTKQGKGVCNQTLRLVAAVYRWHQGTICEDLPDWPRKVAELHSLGARDSALSDDDLRKWWAHEVTIDGATEKRGVSTLGTVKRIWWMVALLTGARRGSVEALRWEDIDLDKKTMRFSTAKAGRCYSVPMSEILTRLLVRYRKNPDVLPDPTWVFPSPTRAGEHIAAVKNLREGIKGPHSLRHTFRTTLAQLGAPDDSARILMGHSMSGSVSHGYVTSSLVVESLRPLVNQVATHYKAIIPKAFE